MNVSNLIDLLPLGKGGFVTDSSRAFNLARDAALEEVNNAETPSLAQRLKRKKILGRQIQRIEKGASAPCQ